jgi:hypothetical protein
LGFSQTTTAAMVNLVWAGAVSRIYIPRSSFAWRQSAPDWSTWDFPGPHVNVMLIMGTPIRLALLFLPVPVLLLVCFSWGWPADLHLGDLFSGREKCTRCLTAWTRTDQYSEAMLLSAALLASD